MISTKDMEPVGGPLRPCGPPPAPVAAAMRASRVADGAWEAAGTCHCSESSQQARWPWWRGHYRKQSPGTDLSGEGGGDTPPCMWTLVHSPLMMRTRNMSTGQFPAAARDSLSSEVFSSPLQTQKRPQEKSAALERGLVGHKEHQQSGEAPGKLAPATPLPHSRFTRKGFRIPRTRKGLNRETQSSWFRNPRAQHLYKEK